MSAFNSTRPLSSVIPRPAITKAHFLEEIVVASNAAFPSSQTRNYDQVKVLLLSWTTDDLNCLNKVHRLRDCFSVGYQFHCEADLIPDKDGRDPSAWLNGRLDQALHGMTEKDLLIFYYAGHGIRAKYDANKLLFYSGSWLVHLPDGRYIEKLAEADFTWAKSHTLDTAKPNVLMLLDTSHAASAAIGNGKEMLGAYAVDAETIPGCNSFTASIVEELTHAASTNEFLTVAQLYFKLLDQALKSQLAQWPCYAPFADGTDPRTSIFLVPRSAPNLNLSGRNAIPIGTTKYDLKCLMSVTLPEESQDALDDLRTWLSSAPHRVQLGVSFESCYAGSCMVIFKVPCAIWYCMRSHESLQWLGFVKEAAPQPLGSSQGESISSQ